jgi:AraC-like DNA-binding protein
LLPIVLDWGFAGAIRELRRRAPRRLELQLWLSYPEQPHHAELRALVSGPVVFDAPCNRLQLPAAELDRPLPGDPQLLRLARAQLDERLRSAAPAISTRERVCLLLRARLDSDPSLDCIARELGVSSRTLRRRLAALGTTFQDLVEELRRAQAAAWLGDDTLSIDVISRRLGYRDASNFRRAFRRWQGITPSEYRARQRPAVAPNDGSWPARPLPAPRRVRRDSHAQR